ncbi:hypothetical protein HMPREF0494_0922 [Limosilactobacillus antri DSM 16041]|uniref:Uncharacterized protein n=1 Tax=Limosilactobacillus antri DSM 16041 TaxID=525309 RepID=C8P6H8_9LACO|nr:hypothetical protein HMPREF0494_0922 [Limosilactobacillus antri DSM 16041]KRK60863.1 hypothetical protein FC31_GL000054 [Limosilactobacillus antri DSM 16041]
MLSLIELAKKEKLEKTGAKPKLPIKIDGVSSETLDVYRIPLEYVYYNDKNGRIATGISQYREKLHPANDRENPQYNNFVAKLIEQVSFLTLKNIRNNEAMHEGIIVVGGMKRAKVDSRLGDIPYFYLNELSKENIDNGTYVKNTKWNQDI